MCGIKSVGENILVAMEQEDRECISAAEAKIPDCARLSHRKHSGERNQKEEVALTTYFSGAFRLLKTPDI